MSSSSAKYGRKKFTFVAFCPASKTRHSFTLAINDILCLEKLEDIAKDIRYASPGKLSQERSRALMEVIFKVIEWVKGERKKHPVLRKIVPHSELQEWKGIARRALPVRDELRGRESRGERVEEETAGQ